MFDVQKLYDFDGKGPKYQELISVFEDVFKDLLVPSSYLSKREVFNTYISTRKRVIVLMPVDDKTSPWFGRIEWIWNRKECVVDGYFPHCKSIEELAST